jgi:hypothetical protein
VVTNEVDHPLANRAREAQLVEQRRGELGTDDLVVGK